MISILLQSNMEHDDPNDGYILQQILSPEALSRFMILQIIINNKLKR